MTETQQQEIVNGLSLALNMCRSALSNAQLPSSVPPDVIVEFVRQAKDKLTDVEAQILAASKPPYR